jgi:hypothetical protein
LRQNAVETFESITTSGAIMDAAIHSKAPLVVFDEFNLDVSVRLVDALERCPYERPVVVVVSSSLERGLAELGWTRSTYRVGFVRTQNLLDDLERTLDELLKTEPTPDFDRSSPGPSSLELRWESETNAALDDLSRSLTRIEWAGPQAHRVVSSLNVECALAENDALKANITLMYMASFARFYFNMTAAIPQQAAFFAARRPTTARDTLEQLRDTKVGDRFVDDTFICKADDNGLVETRALLRLIANAARNLDFIELSEYFLVARSEKAMLEPTLVALSTSLDLWRALARRRLGIGA